MNPDPMRVFRQFLELRGLKFTKQRERILTYLLKLSNHMSSEEIYKELKRKDVTVGRATVFRTLGLLEDVGFANRIQLAGGKQAYEPRFARPHHDHLICVKCGRVTEFINSSIERFQNRICRQYQFLPLWHQHVIFGKCKMCSVRRGEQK